MSAETPGPLCPRCRRRIAAWKLDHCVYCGESFPPDLREGFAEPEALKWVERPAIPPDAARQLELMKVIPMEKDAKPRSVLRLLTLISLPVFAVLFYLLYQILRRYSPAFSVLVLVGGAGFLAYLAWSFAQASGKDKMLGGR